MFKFLKDDDEEEKVEETKNAEVKEQKLNEGMEMLPSRLHSQIVVDVPHLILPQNVLHGKDATKYISVSELLRSKFTKDDDKVRTILDSSSDLISGVYEGGFKIWECTFDLIDYLRKNSGLFTLQANSSVLDLGCGSGLLGLYALSCSASASVHFQDYNPEVIDFLTIPNVILNFGEESHPMVKFYSGDWSSFDSSSKNTNHLIKYDYILSSETIYNVGSLEKLHDLVLNHLKPSGKLYLAAKTCYFGVGGGTIAFKRLVEVKGSMECEVVLVVREGVQREILCVKFKCS